MGIASGVIRVCGGAALIAVVAGRGYRARDDRRQLTSIDVGPCIDGSEFVQRHGTNCVCCHNEFGVAGSVSHDAGVVEVLVTDANGVEVAMAPNPFDNFFRHYVLEPPFRAQITLSDGSQRTMDHEAPHGSCNACHGVDEKMLGER